ncbi:cytochrome P450-like protein, partial [Ganoderma leucocontextum]
SILHDDKVYSDPHTFAPDRFLKNGVLNPDILDPQDVAFGFGRRACPGRHMAYDTMWITIATVLMCTEICPAKDGAGREIEVKEDYASSFVTEPRPFPCHVRFRSEAHAALLEHMM